jgi:uncharacterized metal-binding protein
MTEEERLSQLADLEVDLFVCGAMDKEFENRAGSYGIRVVHDVAAEVDEALVALRNGRLHNGFGLNDARGRSQTPTKHPEGEMCKPTIDCVECVDRRCLKGETCTGDFGELFSAEKYNEFHHSMEVTTDIAAETHRRLCRVAEFIYYCLGMEYKHVGVAFCVEMFRETEILVRLLRRFFAVSSVCCKVGGRIEADLITASRGVLCNPIGQAHILNELKPDINVLVGLCVGCDLIFVRHSKAPTSTLFVKDKSLANNPVSALYSKYYIDEILKEI